MNSRPLLLTALSITGLVLAACGDGTGPGQAEPEFKTVVAGDDHACLIGPDARAHCWGLNVLGQLGDGDSADRLIPTPVSGHHRFRELTAGSAHTCGLTEDGTAWCWGSNALGALGDGSPSTRSQVPVLVATSLRFQTLAAGTGYTCGVAMDGSGWCWGSGGNGELGNGDTADYRVPSAVAGGLRFKAITTGLFHTCALTTGGQAYCWGDNQYGKMGTGNLQNSLVPQPVSGNLVFKAIDAGDFHTCALAGDGQAYCWGSNVSFELGIGSDLTTFTTEPTPVAGHLVFNAFSVGSSHACGVTPRGDMYCWGASTYGKLGRGSETATLSPVLVSGGH
ncbi:MAG: RCC1 domain-containing protein, partial [Gemmatimonadales bacterium]